MSARESGGGRSLLEAEECFRDFHFGEVAAFVIGAKRERRMLDVHLKLNGFVLQSNKLTYDVYCCNVLVKSLCSNI